MPFVNRRDASLALRREAEKRYRKELRSALSNPGLSAEQKVEIRRKLQNVGKPRVYDAKSPPPPGAIDLSPRAARYVEEDLAGMRKVELQELSRENGLPVSGTKADLVERLRRL